MTRMTISINSELEDVLRTVQCKFILTDKKSWSISKIINMMLASAVMNSNNISVNDWNKIKSYINGSKLEFDNIRIEEFVDNLIDLKKIERY